MIAKTFHIILALLFFCSSTGFVLNKHYCQNELKSFALFVATESCHEQNMPADCPFHQMHANCQDEEGENDCCEDESDFIKLEQDQQVTNLELPISNLPITLSTVFLVFDIDFTSLSDNYLQYLIYKPPIVCDNIPALLQTFLL